jgi:hypothetical protein
MERRRFLQQLATAGAVSAFPRSMPGQAVKSPSQGSHAPEKLGYFRAEVPSFQIAPYSGDHYIDVVPDTYDIAERASLALSALTRLTDPAIDYEQYFLSVFYKNPPVLRHESSDPFASSQEAISTTTSIRFG